MKLRKIIRKIKKNVLVRSEGGVGSSRRARVEEELVVMLVGGEDMGVAKKKNINIELALHNGQSLLFTYSGELGRWDVQVGSDPRGRPDGRG